MHPIPPQESERFQEKHDHDTVFQREEPFNRQEHTRAEHKGRDESEPSSGSEPSRSRRRKLTTTGVPSPYTPSTLRSWRVAGREQRRMDIPTSLFRRGDINDSDVTDWGDAINILEYALLGTFTTPCLDAGDVDDNGAVDFTDGINLLIYVLLGGGIGCMLVV